MIYYATQLRNSDEIGKRRVFIGNAIPKNAPIFWYVCYTWLNLVRKKKTQTFFIIFLWWTNEMEFLFFNKVCVSYRILHIQWQKSLIITRIVNTLWIVRFSFDSTNICWIVRFIQVVTCERILWFFDDFFQQQSVKKKKNDFPIETKYNEIQL